MPSSEPRPQLGLAKGLGFFGVSCILLLGISLLLDRALGLFGFADEVAVGPPPNFEAEIENVEFRYTLRTNDRGIRYRTIPIEKPKGLRRVVLLGDSATEGMGVSDEDRWSDRVERMFRDAGGLPVEMINCAETGTSPFNYGQKLFHVCLDYDPDLVVIAMHRNDLPAMKLDLEPEQMLPGSHVRRSTILRSLAYRLWPHVYTLYRDAVLYQNERQRRDIEAAVRAEAERRGIPQIKVDRWRALIPDQVLEEANKGRINPALLTYAIVRPESVRLALDLDGDTARAKLDALRRVLSFIRERCEARGIEVALVLMPSPYQYDPRAPERLQAKLYEAVGFPMRPEWRVKPTRLEVELARWSQAEGLPFLNLAEVFREAVRESDRPLNWEFDNHMTPYGHEVAAEAVHRWLLELRTFRESDGSSEPVDPQAAGAG